MSVAGAHAGRITPTPVATIILLVLSPTNFLGELSSSEPYRRTLISTRAARYDFLSRLPGRIFWCWCKEYLQATYRGLNNLRSLLRTELRQCWVFGGSLGTCVHLVLCTCRAATDVLALPPCHMLTNVFLVCHLSHGLKAQQLRRPQQLQVLRCSFGVDILHDLHPVGAFILVHFQVPHGRCGLQGER